MYTASTTPIAKHEAASAVLKDMIQFKSESLQQALAWGGESNWRAGISGWISQSGFLSFRIQIGLQLISLGVGGKEQFVQFADFNILFA